jgi:hypothetical protein
MPVVTEHDRNILREVAARYHEIAEGAKNQKRRELWTQHNDLKETPPLVLIESFPATFEYVTDDTLECEDEWARGQERALRLKISHYEQIDDDDAVDPFVSVGWQVSATGYGVAGKREQTKNISDESAIGVQTSYRWEPPIQDIERDFHKLKPREFTVNREATFAQKDFLEEVYGDVLPVRIRGGYGWTSGMTIVAIDLIGLEQLMLYMYDDPDGLHKIMAFLRDDHIAYAKWLERECLLNLNNEGDYVGSGGRGFTNDLPQADLPADSPPRLKDLWVLSESQETVGVGPDQFSEFIFPYQKAVNDLYGLTYYGCCEPVHSRWHVLKEFENLRTVSVSPWADENLMGEALGRNYVYSRKPNPTLISTSVWDEDGIRDDIRATLNATKGCNVELIMKDVHTLAGQPERAARWVELTREVIREFGWDV